MGMTVCGISKGAWHLGIILYLGPTDPHRFWGAQTMGGGPREKRHYYPSDHSQFEGGRQQGSRERVLACRAARFSKLKYRMTS